MKDLATRLLKNVCKTSTVNPAQSGFQCKLRLTFKQLKYIFVALLCVTVYYVYQNYNDKVFMYFANESYDAPCVIPELDPFDPSMMAFVERLPPLTCDNRPIVVYIDTDNIIKFNETALKLLDEDITTVMCTYSLILRTDQRDSEVEFSDPIPFNPPYDIEADWFLVSCTGRNGKELFHNTLAKIHKSEKDFERHDDHHYNLLLFGVDSLARSTALRQLPMTIQYLKKELEGTDFQGYMKVGDGTFDNIIPLLTGRHAWGDDLPDTDYYTNLDSYPFIWKTFSENKYATFFAEDMPHLAMFNGGKAGFKDWPTDHYMRPFWLANYKLTPMHNLVTHVSRLLENNKLKISKQSAMCIEDRKNHVVLIDYLKQFMRTYRDKRKFMLTFLTELSHEFQNFLNFGDQDFFDFFKWMKDEGFLDNTIVVMFGDHGPKFGSTQHLFVARVENRMPLALILLPKTLRERYPNIVKSFNENEHRLATTFDLHGMIRDVVNGKFQNPTKFSIQNKQRGISLFQTLPKVRSCKDAEIKENFCACYKSSKLNITGNVFIERVSKKIVSHINQLLVSTPECAPLSLKTVMEARKIEPGLTKPIISTRKNLWIKFAIMEPEKRDDTRYNIMLQTTPGDAEFHATCAVSPSMDVTVFGNVDRINKYGNQSHCVRESRLKPLCFCQT